MAAVLLSQWVGSYVWRTVVETARSVWAFFKIVCKRKRRVDGAAGGKATESPVAAPAESVSTRTPVAASPHVTLPGEVKDA